MTVLKKIMSLIAMGLITMSAYSMDMHKQPESLKESVSQLVGLAFKRAKDKLQTPNPSGITVSFVTDQYRLGSKSDKSSIVIRTRPHGSYSKVCSSDWDAAGYVLFVDFSVGTLLKSKEILMAKKDTKHNRETLTAIDNTLNSAKADVQSEVYKIKHHYPFLWYMIRPVTFFVTKSALSSLSDRALSVPMVGGELSAQIKNNSTLVAGFMANTIHNLCVRNMELHADKGIKNIPELLHAKAIEYREKDLKYSGPQSTPEKIIWFFVSDEPLHSERARRLEQRISDKFPHYDIDQTVVIASCFEPHNDYVHCTLTERNKHKNKNKKNEQNKESVTNIGYMENY